MALHITQCLSTTSSGQILQADMQEHKAMYQKFTGKARELIEFACGNRDVSNVVN